MTEIEEIESNYDVVSAKVEALYIWPLIRQSLTFYFIGKKTGFSAKKRSRKKFQILKNSLYGFRHLFKLKRYDYLFFNNADKRTAKVKDKNFDVFFDGWADSLGQEKSLFIEWAIQKHFPLSLTYSKNVISDLSFKLFSALFTIFVDTKNIDKNVFITIKNDYDLDFRFEEELKSKLGEIKFYRLLFRWIRPKKVFLISSFTKMPIVIAAHLENIHVYEAQHGYIGDNHQSYKSTHNFGKLYYPDYLLSFGEYEKKNIPQNFIFKANQIKPIGSFYLEKVKDEFYDPMLEKLSNDYSTIFCVTLQTVKEIELLDWITLQAKTHPNWLFILKPRDSQYLNYTAYTALPNIAFYSGYNVYQILKYSNFNITIYSTTSVEAEFYGVKTLFFNIDNLSKTYFNIDKLYGALIDPLENISEHHLNTEERDSSSYFVSNYVNNVANCL